MNNPNNLHFEYEESIAVPQKEHNSTIYMHYILNPPVSFALPLISLESNLDTYRDKVKEAFFLYLHTQREAVKEILERHVTVDRFDIHEGTIRVLNEVQLTPSVHYSQFIPSVSTQVSVEATLSHPIAFIDLPTVLKDQIISAIQNCLSMELTQRVMENIFSPRYNSDWRIN